eukprot:scaffold17565_cov124-Isochrysis_galbana.AAC.2
MPHIRGKPKSVAKGEGPTAGSPQLSKHINVRLSIHAAARIVGLAREGDPARHSLTEHSRVER